MLVFFIWIILIILWNYGYPEAVPLLDVLASLVLYFFSKFLNSFNL
tara:strand:- start:243 stop:380 length:138 start_codon:yes stop_codon:yes gene_type:complete